MNELRIVTNNVPRDLIDDFELTPEERLEFDYINWKAIERGEDSRQFFRYKGELYDLSDIERSLIEGWDGQVSESFFSGILVRFGEDHESIIVGRYYC